MFWDERMETLKGRDLAALQLGRLKWTVAQAARSFSGELRDLHQVRARIATTLRETLGIRTGVRLVEPGSLSGSEGKTKRIGDRRRVLF